MVQVIYEEHEDEYWQKPLREAINKTADSWAGAVVRRQTQAYDYAKNVANNAHQTFITQMGIKSRERIASTQLAATKARNKVLDRQNFRTHKLAQKVEDRNQKQVAYDREQDQKAVDATAAVDELYQAQNRFVIRNGEVMPEELTRQDYNRIKKTIQGSSAIWQISKKDIEGHDARRRDIAGRLNMLRSLVKTHGDSVYSDILKTPEGQAVNVLNMTGKEGSAADTLLQSLAGRVTNDNSWKAILKSFDVDENSMKEWQSDDLAEYGRMLTNNNLEVGNNTYKGGLQKSRVLQYNDNVKAFSDEQSNIDADALLAKLAGQNLDQDQKQNIRTTSGLLNSAAIRFMHETNGFFTNPSMLKNQIMDRVAKIVQNPDPEEELTDPLDIKIRDLIQHKGSEQDKQNLVREVLTDFISDNKYVSAKAPKYKSVVGDQAAMIAKIQGLGATDVATNEDEELVADNAGDIVLTNPPTSDDPASVTDVTNEQFLVESDNQTVFDYFYKPGKMFGITNGKVDSSGVNLRTIDPKKATYFMFSKDPENLATETGKFFQGFIAHKKGLAYGVPDEDIKAFREGTHPRIVNNPNLQKKIKTAIEERKKLEDIYRYNREVAVQTLLQGDVPLLGQDGLALEWLSVVKMQDPDTGAVYNIDRQMIDEEFPANDPRPFAQTVRKQLLTILKSMNMDNEANDTGPGNEFSVSKQLRLLGNELVATGGVAKYRRRIDGVEGSGTNIAARRE